MPGRLNNSPMQVDAKKPKIKQTIKDLFSSDQLVKGRVLLDKKLAEQKVMAEAMEFEARNRRNKSGSNK